MNYRDFRKHIKEISPDQVEEYALAKESVNNGICGQRKKKFVRFSSDIFSELINELKNNPSCVYATYVNDIIKEGYIPDFVSVMLKEENKFLTETDEFKIGYFREVIASRIMNFFECPTSYETLININGDVKCCSIDFNRVDEDLYVADELPPYGAHFENLGSLINDLDYKIKTYAKDVRSKGEDVEIDFMSDYVYSYLMRKLVLVDRDFGFQNVGVVHNTKEGTLKLAPNFDFEYTFEMDKVINNKTFWKYRQEDLKYAQKYYPDTYRKFMNKYNEFVYDKQYENIIRNVIGNGKKSQNFALEYGKYLNHVSKIITTNFTM